MLSSLLSKLSLECGGCTSAGLPALPASAGAAPVNQPVAPPSGAAAPGVAQAPSASAPVRASPMSLFFASLQHVMDDSLSIAQTAHARARAAVSTAANVQADIQRQKQKVHAHNQKLFAPHIANVVKQSGFPAKFWSAIAHRQDIAYTGSSVVSGILGVEWKNQDRDIFVSSSMLKSLDAIWDLLDMV